MSEEEIEAKSYPAVYKTKDKPTNDYINIIYKMYIDGIKPEVIFSYILKMGFKGTYRMLDNHICRIVKNSFGISLAMN